MESVEKEYLTSQEAAEVLRVTPATVMNMIKRGQLRGRKVGIAGKSSPWRIYKEDVMKYIELEEETVRVKTST